MNAVKSHLMLLRRELWEHRGVVITPAVIATLIMLMLIVLLRGLGGNVSLLQIVQGLAMMPPAQREATLAVGLASVTPLFLVPMLVLIVFYAADALYAERRDRSILFWKSLPVTDLATAVSKLITAVVVIPLVTAAFIIVTQLVALLFATFVVWGLHGADAWALVWQPAPLLRLWVLMIYSLLAVMLWYLPFLGWLLLASAWARKAPLLWAVLPVVVIGQLEILALGTSRIYGLIGERVIGVFGSAFRRDIGQLVQFDGDSASVRAPTDLAGERLLSYIDLPGLLTAPGFWGGIAVAAGFVALAVVLRRFRDEA